jgi:AraC-like DNA-binding protein
MTELRPIRSASLRGYVELVRSLGHDPQPFLRAAGLSMRLLADPETMISSDAVRGLLEDTAVATGTEDFALRLAAMRDLGNLGPISLVLKDEPTPRQALDTLCRYLRLLNASLVTRIEDAGNAVLIREDLVFPGARSARQSVEMAVGVKFRILRELIGPHWRPLGVSFSHRPPADPAAHRAFFGQKVAFHQEFNGLVCAAADLQIPQTPSNPGVAGFARRYLESVLSSQRAGSAETVRQLILALLPGGRCTTEQVALHLRVDRRTLHRHLASDNLSFSELLQQVRTDLVVRHLRDSDLPVGDVASLLGFASASAFSHWFRSAFGCSAQQWRRQAPTNRRT